MISRYYKFIVIALIFIQQPTITAQKQWSLPECIEYASFNNIEIRIQELNIEMQEQNVMQSKFNTLPNLNANGSGSYNWGKTVDRYTNEFADSRVLSVNLYLQSSVTLFKGFQLLNNVKKQNLELQAQRQELIAAMDMKSMEITTAYLQILYGKENLQTKKQQAELTNQLVERTQSLVSVGSLAEGDLFNMKAQLASDISLKVQAENDLALAFLNLKQLLDLPADTAFDIQTPIITLSEAPEKLLTPDQIYSIAMQNRPEIQSANYRLERSMRDYAISRAGYYPTLSLSAGIGTGYSGLNQIIDGNPVFKGFYPNGSITSSGDTVLTPNFSYNFLTKPYMDQFNENQNYSVGLYLSIPIFNNYQTKSQSSIAKINIQQNELLVEKAKRDLRKTIEQAYADARNGFNSYQSALLSVKALEEAFSYASKKYEAGLLNSYEFNDAKTKVENAKNNLLNSKYNYIFRVKVLDFYYGKPLTF
jgi:outer membrane protein